MYKIDLELQTLTPLWTGAIETGKMQRIQESGILGSLRWWYEAIIRGLGGTICNPTSDDDRCPQNDDSYCPICELFGATGKSRGFRLTLAGGDYLFPPSSGHTRIHIVAPEGATGWHLGVPFLATNDQPVRGRFVSLRGDNAIDEIAIVVALISNWGGLGTKTQHGWGTVRTVLKRRDGSTLTPNIDALASRFPGEQNNDRGLPSLSNMFFCRLYLHEDIADDWWKAQEGALWKSISPPFASTTARV